MDNKDLNSLNNLDEKQPEEVIQQTPIESIENTTAVVTDLNNLEYSEVLKPGEEIDDFHHETETEVIDTKFLSNNVLAIVTIIIALFIPVIPLILGIISLSQIKKTHQGGKPLAIIAIIINIIVIIIEFIFLLYVLRIGPFEDKLKNVTDDQMRICKNIVYGCDNDEDEDGFKTCSYCKDGEECNDIVTIECPTDELLKQESKSKNQREKIGLDK